MNRYNQMAELQRHWTPPRELARSTPREVRLAGGGIALVVLAVVLLLVGVGLGILMNDKARRQAEERDLLSEQGREVQGVITRLWHTTDKDSRYRVAYRFDVDGRTYRGSADASERVWKTLVDGAAIAIRFVPSNPAINHPRDWEGSVLPRWMPLIGLLFAIFPAVLMFQLRREMHLLREGRAAPAIVTRYSSAQHGKKNFHYEFPLLSGAMAKGKGGPRRKLPAIGDTVCVIYDPENPRRNTAYPMDMVKPGTVS